MRILRADPPDSTRHWAAVLSRPDWVAGAITLKRDGDSWVRRATLTLPSGPRDTVIKCRPLAPADRLKSLLRLSRFHRHWRGAGWLTAHNFPTARPLALARASIDARPCELLILESLPGKSVLQHLADNDLSIRQQHALARALGRMLARLAAAGRYNRDGKPSNLIVTRCTDSDAEVAIIDTVAIRREIIFRPRYVPSLRSLANLVIEAIGTGHTPRCALMARVLSESIDEFPHWLGLPADFHTRPGRRAEFRGLWRKSAALVAAHGDPTPRTHPLSSVGAR